jgi:hypothetical protein
MDTVVVIIVLITLLVLFGGAAWFFVRETGVENAKLWLTSPRQMRQIVTPFRGDAPSAAPKDEHLNPTEPLPREREAGLVLDDSRLRELAEELRGELTRAAGRTRDFDARLTRIEEEALAAKSLPETIDRSVNEVEIRTKTRISKLRRELHTVRKAETPYATRRSEALASLYTRLARADAALAAVVNPMLLPGEPLRVPDVLFDDTLEWENWADVGERAYEFGEVFNQNRLLLEPELASRVEEFISTLREALTDTIYPIVRLPSPTVAQKAQLRAGLEKVIGSIAPLRREVEDAYRATSAAPMPVSDDEDDED